MLPDDLLDLPLSVYLLPFTVLLLWLSVRRPPGFPPGPPLIPLFGNALSLDSDPQVTFRRLRRQYGDIFSVYIFNKPVIVLNGYKVIKDALVKNGNDFSARPYSFLTDHMANGRGIVFSSGPLWQEHRAFGLKAMKELGMGSHQFEEQILKELSFLTENLLSLSDTESNFNHLLNTAIANVISFFSFGERFDYGDPKVLKLINILEENITNLKSANILNVLPVVRFIPGDPFRYERTLNNIRILENDLVIPLKNMRLHGSQDDTNNFSSLYMKEMNRRHKLGSETYLKETELNFCLVDFFTAGTETTGTVIRWALVYCLNYPDVQEKCFQEIKEKIGLNRSPSMKDKTSLPYLEATIAETLRLCDAVPANLPHTVSRDIHFQGYFLPKGITIIPLLSSVLTDSSVWGDPEEFHPGRFLDSDGKFVRREELIPFSIGRRECLGEPLARMELFLFLAGLLQKFEFRCGKDGPPSMKCRPGIINRPVDFSMKIILRDISI